VWKVTDTAGQSFEITLSGGGAAKASRGEGMVGTWKEEGKTAVITWNTGWSLSGIPGTVGISGLADRFFSGVQYPESACENGTFWLAPFSAKAGLATPMPQAEDCAARSPGIQRTKAPQRSCAVWRPVWLAV
jgi:hypothetical protein